MAGSERPIRLESAERTDTPEILALRGLVGGLRDPLPRADALELHRCDDCGHEHRCYRGGYLTEEAAASGLVTVRERRTCYGCLSRQARAPSAEDAP